MYKQFKRPEIPQEILNTEIVDWKFRDSITSDHGKYCIRYNIIFQNGKTKNVQRGGFRTKKEALQAKEQILIQLNNHTYIPYQFTVQEFFVYCLYYFLIDEIKCSYETFTSYRNIIQKCKKVIDPNTKMIAVTRQMLVDVFLSYTYNSIRQNAYRVISAAFKVALRKNIIAVDPSVSAKEYVKKIKKDEDALMHKKRNRSFTKDELNLILHKCRETDPDLYLLLLFSAATGVRISEARAVCFSDIDYENKTVTISRQLGRGFNDQGMDPQLVARQFLPLKTKNAYRTIPLPDFLLDELILQEQKCKLKKQNDELYLKDVDFVFTTDHGYPLSRGGTIPKKFKKLLTLCGIDASLYHWHDLRHTYATLLRNENQKALAKIMGHRNYDFTERVYVDTSKDIYAIEEVKFMNQYIQQLLDNNNHLECYDISSMQSIIDCFASINL